MAPEVSRSNRFYWFNLLNFLFNWHRQFYLFLCLQIAAAKPGPFAYLNYRKSDVWAVGAIAYEIFNAENPFYNRELKITSVNYKEEDLPQLPETVPQIIRQLVANLLSKSSNKVCF